MQTLSSLKGSTYLSLLPPDAGGHAAAREALAALLAAATGPETAGLFAPTRAGQDHLEFLVPPGEVARFDELDPEGQRRLRAEIGRLLSELRRTAALAAEASPAASGGLPALVAAAREVPSWDLVFAQAGRPVLAGWGLAQRSQPQGVGLLAGLDDGLPPSAPAAAPAPALPLAALALGAAGLLLLAAGAVLALPALFHPAPRICAVEDNDVAALRELDDEKARERELRARIADLLRERGQRQIACPLPQPPPPEPVRQPPPREQAPPPARPEPPPQPPREEPRPPRPPPAPPPQPPPPPPPPQRPADAEPCNVETRSGGRGVTVTRHYLGPTRGPVTLQFDARSEPDRIEVFHQGRLIADSGGFRSGAGVITFPWNPRPNARPEDLVVEVRVTGTPGSTSTVWAYRLGCPG